MAERFCLDCGARLYGRSDKKFCSDHCRNNYNNNLNRDANEIVRNVHSLLRKNRKVLADFYEGGKRRIHLDALVVSGYNFTFFTQQTETDEGVVCKYCYEYGYRELSGNYIQLMKNTGFPGQDE